MKYHIYLALEKDTTTPVGELSERALAKAAGISRSALRSIKAGTANLTLSSIGAVAAFFGREVEVIVSDARCSSDLSIVATAYKIERDGFASWQTHLMDFVDEFRRHRDPKLILLPPPRDFDEKLTALTASLVRYLCEEVQMNTPRWATERRFLGTPWFVSGVESLKAMAILESPTAFRSNNIFVLQNFAQRA